MEPREPALMLVKSVGDLAFTEASFRRHERANAAAYLRRIAIPAEAGGAEEEGLACT
jgi:hypothetical protein